MDNKEQKAKNVLLEVWGIKDPSANDINFFIENEMYYNEQKEYIKENKTLNEQFEAFQKGNCNGDPEINKASVNRFKREDERRELEESIINARVK